MAHHPLGCTVGVQDGPVLLGEKHAAFECVEGLGHSVALDRARVEHLADCDRAAQMGQQKLTERDLALGEGALSLHPGCSKQRRVLRTPNEEMGNIIDIAKLTEIS